MPYLRAEKGPTGVGKRLGDGLAQTPLVPVLCVEGFGLICLSRISGLERNFLDSFSDLHVSCPWVPSQHLSQLHTGEAC